MFQSHYLQEKGQSPQAKCKRYTVELIASFGIQHTVTRELTFAQSPSQLMMPRAASKTSPRAANVTY